MKNLTLENITKSCNGIFRGNEALLSEEKVSSAPIAPGSDGTILDFASEDDYSADAYADAEQMLKEMLGKI